MSRWGFIHDKVDILKLILFILNRLEEPVDFDTLADLTLCDGGIGYFDVVECAADLVKTEHIRKENGLYQITDKGRRNGGITEGSLPYSVRQRAEKNALALARAQRRNAMIHTDIQPRGADDKDGFTVKLSFHDGVSEILSLKLYTANEGQAEKLAAGFSKRAEQMYGIIADALLGES